MHIDMRIVLIYSLELVYPLGGGELCEMAHTGVLCKICIFQLKKPLLLPTVIYSKPW